MITVGRLGGANRRGLADHNFSKAYIKNAFFHFSFYVFNTLHKTVKKGKYKGKAIPVTGHGGP
jgi:hypothetical protein